MRGRTPNWRIRSPTRRDFQLAGSSLIGGRGGGLGCGAPSLKGVTNFGSSRYRLPHRHRPGEPISVCGWRRSTNALFTCRNTNSGSSIPIREFIKWLIICAERLHQTLVSFLGVLYAARLVPRLPGCLAACLPQLICVQRS